MSTAAKAKHKASHHVNHPDNQNIAGIDFGATLTKIAFQIPGQRGLALFSSADHSLTELSRILRRYDITHANTVGIGQRPKELQWLTIQQPAHNQVQHELMNQVAGVRQLSTLPKSFLLVSIGTGTSYTHVSGARIIPEPIGSTLGGGYIVGMSRALGFKDFSHVCLAAALGNHKNVDLYHKQLIVSHMQNATARTGKKDLAAGIMNTVAVNIWKDIVHASQATQIVCIGSTLVNNPRLTTLLKTYLRQSGRTAILLCNGEYAGAIGALSNALIETKH